MVAFMPAAALAAMVPFIKSPVIMMTRPVSGPIGIGAGKIIPVHGVSPVPDIPPLTVPVWRSDNIGWCIRIIRSPAILRTEKVVQDAV